MFLGTRALSYWVSVDGLAQGNPDTRWLSVIEILNNTGLFFSTLPFPTGF